MAQSECIEKDTPTEAQKNLYPSTMAKTRKAITTILNEYRADPEADTARFRAQVSALRAIGELHRYDIDERLERLEAALETTTNGRSVHYA